MNKVVTRWLLVALLLGSPIGAQFYNYVHTGFAIDQLPSVCLPGSVFMITDGATTIDCASGGGTSQVPCWCDESGSSYSVLGFLVGGVENHLAIFESTPEGITSSHLEVNEDILLSSHVAVDPTIFGRAAEPGPPNVVFTGLQISSEDGPLGDAYAAGIRLVAPFGPWLHLEDSDEETRATLQLTSAGLDISVTAGMGVSAPYFSPGDAIFYGFDDAGNTDLGTTWTSITLDTEVREDANYTHTADSSDVTVTAAGTYKISAYCTADNGGSSAYEVDFRLVTTGATLIPGSRIGSHLPASTGSRITSSVTVLVALDASDIIRLQGKTDDTGTDVATTPDGCGLLIERIS